MVIVFHLLFFRVGDIVFKLGPEMADRTGYWPGCGISQGTDGVSVNLSLDIPKQVDIG